MDFFAFSPWASTQFWQWGPILGTTYVSAAYASGNTWSNLLLLILVLVLYLEGVLLLPCPLVVVIAVVVVVVVPHVDGNIRYHDDVVDGHDGVPGQPDCAGGGGERRALEAEDRGAAAVHGQVEPEK